MQEKITLDMLTTDCVSVKRQGYTVIDDREYLIGVPHRKEYSNHDRGRQEVLAELPEAQRNAIFAVWGDAPTVNESVVE